MNRRLCLILHISPHHNVEELNYLHEYTSLKELHCSNIGLTVIPELPCCVEELYCFNNKLTELPPLPNNLRELNCSDN